MRSFVVCGATGRTGSVVATELRNRGHQVTAIVRNPSRAGALEARGIRVVPASLENSDAVTAELRREAPNQVGKPIKRRMVML